MNKTSTDSWYLLSKLTLFSKQFSKPSTEHTFYLDSTDQSRSYKKNKEGDKNKITELLMAVITFHLFNIYLFFTLQFFFVIGSHKPLTQQHLRNSYKWLIKMFSSTNLCRVFPFPIFARFWLAESWSRSLNALRSYWWKIHLEETTTI